MRDFALYSSMASVPKRSAHDLDLLPGVCLQKIERIFSPFFHCDLRYKNLTFEDWVNDIALRPIDDNGDDDCDDDDVDYDFYGQFGGPQDRNESA